MTDQPTTPTRPIDGAECMAIIREGRRRGLGDSASLGDGLLALYDRGTNDGFTIAHLGFVAQQTEVVREVAEERERQNAKWGEQNHQDGTGPRHRPLWLLRKTKTTPFEIRAAHLARLFTEQTDDAARIDRVTWRDIFLEEAFEAIAEEHPDKLRTELIQVAAVAQQWAEAIDRRTAALAVDPSPRYLPSDTLPATAGILADPDCIAGKHDNCSGEGLDVGTDQPAPCPCSCHTEGGTR